MLIEKLKKVLKIFAELPKPILIAVISIFLIFLSIPLLITFIRPQEKRVTPPTAPIESKLEKGQQKEQEKKDNLEQAQKQENKEGKTEMSSSLIEAKRREIELMKREGKYFSDIDFQRAQKKEMTKDETTKGTTKGETTKEPNKKEFARQDASEEFVPAVPRMLPPPDSKPGEAPAVHNKDELPHIKMAKQIFEDVMNAKPAVGRVVAIKNRKDAQNQNQSQSQSQSQGQNQNEQNVQNLAQGSKGSFDPKKVYSVGEFYKATIKSTVTSANPQAVVIAQLNEGLKNVKLLGKISGIIEDDHRLNVTFEKLVYNGKAYPVNAIAYSIDKTIGIASELEYNVLAKIFATGSLAFGQAMTDALREDKQTRTSTLWGEVTTQEKAENRFREGVLAGASASFGDVKNKTENFMSKKQDVKIILRENTPILIMFLEIF